MAPISNEQVQSAPALSHPHLERPLANLENEALLPALEILWSRPSLRAVLNEPGAAMAPVKAQRLLGWLWQYGLLEHAD